MSACSDKRFPMPRQVEVARIKIRIAKFDYDNQNKTAKAEAYV
jgi:hypothetical protein